jgi:hypothetical protein
MPRSRKPGLRNKQISYQLTESEYEALKKAAVEAGGVSISHLLRAAGTAVAENPDLRQQWLSAQAQRDAMAAGAAIPSPTTDT